MHKDLIPSMLLDILQASGHDHTNDHIWIFFLHSSIENYELKTVFP